MRRMSEIWKKFIKTVSMVLVGVLTVSAVMQYVEKNSITVEAMQDTLPGIEQLRQEYAGSEEVFHILEIAPHVDAAEIGFYVGGQEPFSCLKDEKNVGSWLSWQEKLATLSSKGKRLEFMNQLKTEEEQVEAALSGNGTSPFSFEEYVEAEFESEEEATAAGYTVIQMEARRLRGYFEKADDSPWQVVFAYMQNRVEISEIQGKEKPYYMVKAANILTNGGLRDMHENAPDTPIYSFNGTYYRYAGTAQSIWESATVSGGDVSGGDADLFTVSGGDAQINFYTVDFELANEKTEDAITGQAIYLVDNRNLKYVGNGGNYNLQETLEGDRAGEEYTLPADTVYFKGGLKNAEVLRNTVLGLQTVEDQASFKIEVDTLTPGVLNQMLIEGKLTAEMLKQYNMFYYNMSSVRKQADGAPYSYTEDIDTKVLELLAVYLTKNEIPSIMETSEIIAIDSNSYSEPYGIGTWGNDAFLNRNKLLYVLLSRDKQLYFTDDNYGSLKDSFINGGVNERREAFNNADGFEVSMTALDKDSNNNYDLYFVKDNVLAYQGSRNPFVKKGFSGVAYDKVKVSGGFSKVLDEIETENMYRKADYSYSGKPLLTEVVDDGAAVRYIVNYPNRRQVPLKSEIRILEIEPATASTKLTEATVKDWMGLSNTSDNNVTITIDTMPITQFIGIIDDLNASYDMIYIGDSMEGLNTVEEGDRNNKYRTTVYNDASMKGLLYSHVGDTVEESFDLSGLLASDKNEDGTYKPSTTHRYSGNDLTVEKYNALLDYMEAYYPIVVANDLVTIENNKLTAVNSNRIDNSSYLYEFLKNAFLPEEGNRADNVFYVAELGNTSGAMNTRFRFSLNKPKLGFENFEILDTRDFIVTGSGGEVNDAVRVVSRQEDGRYELHYTFMIKNEGAVSPNTDYTCKLYLDANADGKFSEVNEELQNVEIIDEYGNAVSNTQLKEGVQYYATRRISESYHGCITWNLEIQQTNNDRIRTSRTGYAKLDATGAVTIKILQIFFHSSRNSNIILQDQIGTWNGNQYEGGDSNKAFYNLARQLQDYYALDITSISRNQFESYIANGYYETEGNNRTRITPETGWLDNMDMLIVGFSDAYNGGASNDWSEKAAEEIKKFAESGRSVMLAHDMTSLINFPASDLTSEYKTKKEVKEKDDKGNETGRTIITYNNTTSLPVAGLIGNNSYTGAFRVPVYRVYRDEEGKEQGELMPNYVSFKEYYWGYNMNRQVRDILGMDMYGVTTEKNAEGIPKDSSGRYLYNYKDVAWNPNSGRSSIADEIQGFTYATMMTRNIEYNQKAYRSSVGGYSNGDKLTYTTNIAKQVNNGQITSYPYKISESIDIKTTHNQYYTLDMNSDADGDGQTDLVVWYTLGANSGTYNSVKDVRNNYYIYNKGNITYTGMGHSATVTDVEAQLFMNTMIASYQAGKKSPEVIPQNAAGVESNTIYHYYDTSLEEEAATEDIYFMVSDMNMTSGTKTLEAKFYVESADGLPVSGIGTNVTELTNMTIYNADGSAVGDAALVPGSKYLIKVPTTLLKSNESVGNEVKVFIQARTIMTFKSIVTGKLQETESPWGTGEVRYVNCELFNLD